MNCIHTGKDPLCLRCDTRAELYLSRDHLGDYVATRCQCGEYTRESVYLDSNESKRVFEDVKSGFGHWCLRGVDHNEKERAAQRKNDPLPNLVPIVHFPAYMLQHETVPDAPSESESDTTYLETDSSLDTNKQNKENIDPNKNRPKCPGCWPIFQPNQLAHIGPFGCVGDDDIY